jgi:hypothetical protein
MRKTIVAVFTAALVMAGGSAALASPEQAIGKDYGRAFGQAIAAAKSTGTSAHTGYPGGLPAFVQVHG